MKLNSKTLSKKYIRYDTNDLNSKTSKKTSKRDLLSNNSKIIGNPGRLIK